MSELNIECRPCTGHGMGMTAESHCHYCNGRGYHKVDTRSDSWIDYCEFNDLDVETGEEKEQPDE